MEPKENKEIEVKSKPSIQMIDLKEKKDKGEYYEGGDYSDQNVKLLKQNPNQSRTIDYDGESQT